MGFSVTASHVIFAIALLAAFSTASSSYWKTQDTMVEARRVMDDRTIDAAHSNLSMVGTPTYNAGGNWYRFTIKNVGSVGLDHTNLNYLVDGKWNWNMSSGWPKLNGGGSATSSKLILPGDTLEVRLDGVTSSPSDLAVVTEYGISLYYP